MQYGQFQYFPPQTSVAQPQFPRFHHDFASIRPSVVPAPLPSHQHREAKLGSGVFIPAEFTAVASPSQAMNLTGDNASERPNFPPKVQSVYSGGKRDARDFQGGGRGQFGYNGPRHDGLAPAHGSGCGHGSGRPFPPHSAAPATQNSVLASRNGEVTSVSATETQNSVVGSRKSADTSVSATTTASIASQVPAALVQPPEVTVWCAICKVSCPSASLEQHKNGKRHKRMLESREHWKKVKKSATGKKNVQLIPKSGSQSFQADKLEDLKGKRLQKEVLPSAAGTDGNTKETEQLKDTVKNSLASRVSSAAAKRKSGDQFEPEGSGCKRNKKIWLREFETKKTNQGTKKQVEPPKPTEVPGVDDNRKEPEQQKETMKNSSVSVVSSAGKRKSRNQFEPEGKGSKRNKMRRLQQSENEKTNQGPREKPPKAKELIPCDLCNITCVSRIAFHFHMKGKKHNANLMRLHGDQGLLGETGRKVLHPSNSSSASLSTKPQLQQGLAVSQVVSASSAASASLTSNPQLQQDASNAQMVSISSAASASLSDNPQLQQGVADSQVVLSSSAASASLSDNHHLQQGVADSQVVLSSSAASASLSDNPHLQQGVTVPQVVLAQLMTYVLSQAQTPWQIAPQVPDSMLASIQSLIAGTKTQTLFANNYQTQGSLATLKVGSQNLVRKESESQQQSVMVNDEAPQPAGTNTRAETDEPESEKEDLWLPQDGSVSPPLDSAAMEVVELISSAILRKRAFEAASLSRVIDGTNTVTENDEVPHSTLVKCVLESEFEAASLHRPIDSMSSIYGEEEMEEDPEEEPEEDPEEEDPEEDPEEEPEEDPEELGCYALN